jgi:putative sigma-54 modulation protein
MEVKIQAIKFDATAKLKEFITKKMNKLERFYEGIELVEVTLKVVKPETSDNKEVEVKLIAPHLDLFASKVSDTFEQSADECAEAIQRQLIKAKEKKQ